ncbi:SEC-C domain-containing protein [Verrucomicrobiaceae bacterium R5-34]|nr:SEC-C domain-containing protein [Verrucomicrobiaceae bacterium R5-34]
MEANSTNTPELDPGMIKQHLSKQHEELVAKVQGLASQIDCENAFISLATSQMLKMSGEGGYIETEHGTIPALIELAAFHLYPNFGKSEARDHGLYQELFDALEKLNSIRGLNTAFAVDHTDHDLAKLQVKLQLYAESVRGSSYPPQIRLRIDKIQGVHETWFAAKAGIGPMRALEILECFEKLVNDNFQRAQSRFKEFSEKMFAFSSKLASSEDPSIVGAERDALGAEMKKFFDDFSETLAVSQEQVRAQLGELNSTEWEALAKLIGTTKESRAQINHPRELRSRPVFFVGQDRFLIVDFASAFDAVFEAFDDLTRTDQSFRDRKYVPKMAKWMEDEATAHFCRVFPENSVFSGLAYPDPDNPGGEAELDGAILWGPFLILSEVKGKQFRARSRLGDPSRLRSDLKKSIEEAFDQASRAIRFIESTDEAVFREIKTGRELKVRKDLIRRIYPISITLHHFGGLATQLANLKRLGLFNGSSFPWSLSLADLDTITRFAGTPDVFLHYAQRRIELQESQEEVMADELDLFGIYLDCRLHPGQFWGRDRKGHKGPRMFSFTGGSERFDDWYQVEQGLKKKPPEIKLDLPPVFVEVIDELRKRDDDGARWIAFALLGLSTEGVQRFSDSIEELRKQAVGGGKVGRVSFMEDDLVVSVIGGKGLSLPELRKQAASRCALEKHRLKTGHSLTLGLRVEDQVKPFDCACWLEGPWEEDPDMDAMIQAERPKFPPGLKLPGRNEPCPCGSGRKFKKCCLAKYGA